MSDGLDGLRKAGRAHQRALVASARTGLALQEGIREARSAGASYRVIAEAAGVSFQRVAQVVRANEKEEK